MRAGRLRHKVILQSKVETQDATYGNVAITWTAQDTVWAAIEPMTAKEYFSQQQLQSEAHVRIVIRYHAGVDTTWRVSHDGLFYDIQAVMNENTRDRMITLMCLEGVKEG